MSVPAVEPIPLAADLSSTLEYVVGQAERARAFATQVVAAGVTRVFLIGAGGSHYSAFPAFDLLETFTSEFAASKLTSAELTHRRLAGLDSSSLVIASSHSGATPETVEAVQIAQKAGARVAGIARAGDSPLAELVDVLFDYPSEVTVTEPKAIHFTQLALALLDATGELPEADKCWQAMDAIPAAIPAAKAAVETLGQAVGRRWRSANLVYVLGAGPNFGAANAMAACYLQEMNWLHAASVHAGDFFHGPFEVVGEHPVLVLVGEDHTRPLAERAAAFARRYYPGVDVLDSRDYELPGVADGYRSLISPLAIASLSRRLLDFVAAERGHNTGARRYMYKVEY